MLSESKRPRSSGMTPMMRRTARGSFGMSMLSMLTWPASGERSVVRIFRRVDFPAPLGPRMAQMPLGISRETSFTAIRLAKRLVMLAQWIMVFGDYTEAIFVFALDAFVRRA